MGGVVVKKAKLFSGNFLTTQAIIDASNDHVYAEIVQNIKATIFIATPHSGVVRSTFWREFLASSSFEQTLIDQVDRNIGVIRKINDGFLAISDRKFGVTSFYENGRMGGGVFPPQVPS
jgi:hypothetical protein